MNRRNFFKLASVGAASSLALHKWVVAEAATGVQTTYGAGDLADWEIALGDGLYAAPGQEPVTSADVGLSHYQSHSELQANTQMRGVMAHNITFKRLIDAAALASVHYCQYEFRLPYIPMTNGWPNNAQTLEASLFVWDGAQSRLDYGMAFQWVLNPWLSSFGTLRIWTDVSGGEWQTIGYLAPDTNWHKLEMVVDYQQRTTALHIDGMQLLSWFATTVKPATWDNQVAARLGAEIISVYPGNNSTAPMHVAEFRNWSWTWFTNDSNGSKNKSKNHS